MASTWPLRTFPSLLAATPFQWNRYRNRKLWNIVSNIEYIHNLYKIGVMMLLIIFFVIETLLLNNNYEMNNQGLNIKKDTLKSVMWLEHTIVKCDVANHTNAYLDSVVGKWGSGKISGSKLLKYPNTRYGTRQFAASYGRIQKIPRPWYPKCSRDS
jgi:hypothetical protein